MGVEVSYGQGQDGFDQFVIEEPNGGGAVTVPYVEIDGELYIGAILQFRRLTGRKITEVSRGFSLPDETHDETSRRELGEEAGVHESLLSRRFVLEGKGVNPNSTFFVASPNKGEGVKFFALPMRPDEVELRRDSQDPKRRIYKLTPQLQGEIKELNERIRPEGIRFFHVDLLRNTSELFTQGAISRILTAPRQK